MLRPLTQNLYLASSAIDVSQPVALGTYNAVNIQATVDAASAGLTSPITVTLQGSNDAENWADISGYSLDQVALSTQFPVYAPYTLPCAFVRLKYVGGGSNALLSASLNLITV